MPNDPHNPNFAFFGAVFRDWRAAVGASQNDIARRGGPSDTLQTDIEQGDWASSRPASTLRKVDEGFGWPEGTARDVLFDGFDPIGAGWPKRLDPEVEQISRPTSTGELRIQRWITEAHDEQHPPSEYLRHFADRQLLEELDRRLAMTTGLVDQLLHDKATAEALSAADDSLHDAIAAYEDERSIAGEQEESETP